ncbi:LRR-containing protein [Plasmopara halstedii]|uniref:LRR-containing protein n=1 Tax=Plasmopara halstedii TaxID=4781 RepID=A0A0N7L5R1_PLAHL|nr:LRR-containing protein [Plasmopara halstedii]CEG42179.1 LRR-containing protein [Plasmopara halstedii]|eukprot:XP_024578548.1 LRR-containing protein [Plasmopara halstedii]
MAPTLSIESYKLKQKVDAVKARNCRVASATLKSKDSYTTNQRQYLNACIEANADPDPKLLSALQKAQFVLKIDRFGKDELAFNMKFLQRTKNWSEIRLSLGSVATSRSLRTKFDRLGLSRAYAYEKEGAALVVRSACASAYKTSSLMRFHLIGVRISPAVVSLLSNAFEHCRQIEDISLSGSNISDKGLEAIAIAIGRCPKLKMISLAGCSLTNNSKEPITKIIALHGVIKDEAEWSSSLRNQMIPAVSSPDLLLDLSRNDLGDETAEAICDGLSSDKWLLGLNLGANNLSQNGMEVFNETLKKRNHTLAVLALKEMKEPVRANTITEFKAILYDRNRYLQQVAMESRERRMTLGALLLDWGVDKDTIIEVCYLEAPNQEFRTQRFAPKMAFKKYNLVSPKDKVDRGCPRSFVGNHNNTCVSLNDSSNQIEAEENSNDGAACTSQSHVNTIEYLIERLSSLENEKRKMHKYVIKIETENEQLRAKLETRTNAMPEPGISTIEAQIIAQLENSISSLAEQVELIEYKQQK